MNKIESSFLIVVLVSTALFCWTDAVSQSIPPFNMQLSNAKVFNAADLPKGKPVILIYFDPDCDHCQTLMKAFFKKINEFKKSEIILVTFKPISDVTVFEKKYQTRKYTNIKVGTEGTTFYLRMYYNLIKMPFTALYDKKGNLNYSYRTETLVDDLIKRFNQLK